MAHDGHMPCTGVSRRGKAQDKNNVLSFKPEVKRHYGHLCRFMLLIMSTPIYHYDNVSKLTDLNERKINNQKAKQTTCSHKTKQYNHKDDAKTSLEKLKVDNIQGWAHLGKTGLK